MISPHFLSFLFGSKALGVNARPPRWPALLAAGFAVISIYLVSCGQSSLVSALQTSTAGGIPISAQDFAFQPITIDRINLPSNVTSAAWPVFTTDGQHLLFFSTSTTSAGGNTGQGATADLWITGLDGSAAHCLSCGLVNDPSSQGEGEVTPFPDGKRVFFGSFFQPGTSTYAVLECSPSIIDCQTASILPVDFSSTDTKASLPGGANSLPQVNSGGAYGAKLSQDGVHVGFSDIRTDSIEVMVVGTLTRSATGYQVTDPRVINPSNPTSATDTHAEAWSNGGALYEFKSFSNGGADASYAQVGGIALGNPDVWSVNLATGNRTRLTAHPDYDEDNAVSPNGRLLALWSNRTMHMTDWYGGLIPVRGFIDTPASLLALSISSSNKRCHGPIWIMPASGDQGGTLAGQPIVYNQIPNIMVTNNLVGWPQWSPDGTLLALNTTNNTAGNGYPAHAPFLLVAHFTAMQPTQSLPSVSSQPGAWATTPAEYHPSMGYIGAMTFPGAGSGSVTVNYAGNVLAGRWSETYTNYSDNGADFVNGAVTITSAVEAGTYSSHLTMTGTHTGSNNTDLTFAGKVQGTGVSTYDGHSVSGPSAEQTGSTACPDLQPKVPALQVAYSSLGNGFYKILVSASIVGVGANEAATDTRPVYHATLNLGGATTYTNSQGVAVITVTGSHDLTVTAGDTLLPTTIHLP